MVAGIYSIKSLVDDLVITPKLTLSFLSEDLVSFKEGRCERITAKLPG